MSYSSQSFHRTYIKRLTSLTYYTILDYTENHRIKVSLRIIYNNCEHR